MSALPARTGGHPDRAGELWPNSTPLLRADGQLIARLTPDRARYVHGQGWARRQGVGRRTYLILTANGESATTALGGSRTWVGSSSPPHVRPARYRHRDDVCERWRDRL